VFAGEVKPRHEADLGFRIGGKLVERYVDVGARVKKGQALARLDPADVGLQAEAAKAQVAATETEYRFAQAEYERYQNLFREKFISASALDAKRNALDANRAKYEQAKANLAVSQNQASYATLVASEDGVVTAIGAEPGQVVAAGQSVVRIAREDEREVAISVPENRIGELARAQRIVAALWATPGRTYAAKVREVSPAVDPATRTFAVRVSIVDPDPAVQWGMTANVALIAPGDAQAALLPLTSIYQKDGKPAVWRYDPATGQVALVPVAIGQYREDGVLVTSGVANGDWIVAAGVNKLVPGQVVRPYEAGPASAVLPAPAGKDGAPSKSLAVRG
jgi:membrane fusion protein, multidrug efflux system